MTKNELKMLGFKYNKEDDTYTCPEHQTLSTNGNWYGKQGGMHRTKKIAPSDLPFDP